MSDPIEQLQRHLVTYSKSLADCIYAIEHSGRLPESQLTPLRASILLAADDLDRLLAGLPDYATLVGPRSSLHALVSTYTTSVEATRVALESSVKEAEEKLAEANRVVKGALLAASASGEMSGSSR